MRNNLGTISLPAIPLPASFPPISAAALPYAYGLVGLAVLFIVKKPSVIVTMASTYFLWQNAIAKAQTALNLK